MSRIVLIVDDEKPARSKLCRFLAKLPEKMTIMEAGDGEEAVRILSEHNVDLIFLDIQMPGLTGFDVIREVGPDVMPPVIFVTAFDQFAVQAFDVNAVDYLLKPFDFERFEIAFRRVNADDPANRDVTETLVRLLQQMDQKVEFRQHLPIKENERIVLLPVREIEWIEADGKYALIHAEKSNHHMRITLQELESRLDPAKFARIHRSHIVNIDFINELQSWFHGDYKVLLKDGTSLRLSRRYSERFLNIFS